MLDTLSYVEALMHAGVPEHQAKLQARALLRAFASTDLATKADITELKVGFAELMAVFEDLEVDIKQIKRDQRGVIVVALSVCTLLFALIYLTF